MAIIDDFLNEDDSSMLDREVQQKYGSKDVYNFLYTETLLQKIINRFKKIVRWQ
jgi:hypothetical protein